MITEFQGLRVRYGSGQCGNINNEQGILRGRFDGRHGDPYSIINQHDTDTESRSDSGVGRGAREILDYITSISHTGSHYTVAVASPSKPEIWR